MAERVQRRRLPGWRTPPGAVYVGRPTRWGNPYVVRPVHSYGPFDVWDVTLDQFLLQTTSREDAHRRAVELYELHTGPMGNHEYSDDDLADIRRLLGGRDLVCWCPLALPCHADILLKIANPTEENAP